MRHWSLVSRTRLLLAAGWVTLLAAIVVSAYGASTAKDGYLRADADRQVELANNNLLVGMVDQETGLRGYLNTGDPAFLEPYVSGTRDVKVRLAELDAAVNDPDLRNQLLTERTAALGWQKWAAEAKSVVDATGVPSREISQAEAGKALFDTFRNGNDGFEAAVEARVGLALSDARNGLRVGFYFLFAAGLVAAVILAVLGRTLTRTTLAPVARLAASARDLAAGRKTKLVATDRTDEIGDLSRALAAWEATAKDRDHIFTLSADMFAISGFDGVFKTVNPAWQKVTGLTPAELTSRPYIDFVHPEDREATIAEGSKLADGARTISFRNRYRCKDGSYRWLDWTAVPVDEEKLIYAVARDITEQQAQEEAIRTLNKELEAFSYSVSHDLRAPLRAIHGFVRILVEEYGAELQEEARRYLDLVAANAQQMGRLVDDLLQFSRMGRQPLNKQRVNVEAIARRAVEQLQPAIEGREIDLAIGELPSVEADGALLHQVFINLIGNAVKYTKGRKPARIQVGATTEANGELVFFIRDNGAGFDMQYAHKLFGVFQRLHRAEEYEGTGVGLALVQRIVSKHGGRVWTEAAVDKGATFFFTLGGAPTWELKAAA